MEAMANVISVSFPRLPRLVSTKSPGIPRDARHRCRLSPSLKCRDVAPAGAKGAFVCRVTDREPPSPTGADEDGFISNKTPHEDGFINQKALQLVLWSMTGVYVVWLFILPYAPGDPIWAIDKETLVLLLDLSLNFFFVLPVANAAGFQLLQSPVIHPTVEALFNLVMGWTLLFGPMLLSDSKRNRFKVSVEALWLGQWLLTNTFLMPYMAVRLNPAPASEGSVAPSKLASAMLSGAKYIALAGLTVGILSVAWGLGGRPETTVGDRWEYFLEYVRTDRVGYAFVWDLCLYSIFQPWLIQSNLHNIKSLQMQKAVSILRFIPYVGMVAYLWGLSNVEVAAKALNSDKTN